jgi:hypothetical protein
MSSKFKERIGQDGEQRAEGGLQGAAAGAAKRKKNLTGLTGYKGWEVGT